MEFLGNFSRWCHQSNLPHRQKVLKILLIFWKSKTFFFHTRNSLVQIFWTFWWILQVTAEHNEIHHLKSEFQSSRTRMSYRNEHVKDRLHSNQYIHKNFHVLYTVVDNSIKEDITSDRIPKAAEVLMLLPETTGLEIVLNIICTHMKMSVTTFMLLQDIFV